MFTEISVCYRLRPLESVIFTLETASRLAKLLDALLVMVFAAIVSKINFEKSR